MKSNDIILEIRPGVGGDEAELWARQLFEMYERLANKLDWQWHTIAIRRSELGGVKEAVIEVVSSQQAGDTAYELLRREAGVHRVQRIPQTEKRGRIHTSTATVAILPVVTEQEVNIKSNEIQTEFYRASGHGGQNVNKVETAVRIRHTPTGLIVTSQDERSQAANREKAMAVLRSKLYQLQKERIGDQQQVARVAMIGTGDRSEKIRTYNFSQDRVTDHRLKKSWSGIEKIFAGDVLKIIEVFRSENLENPGLSS